MTATNHAVTGALIAAVVPNPFLGLFLAFASHFALDVLPHFDEAGVAKNLTKKQHIAMLATDGLLATTIVILMIIVSGASAPLLVAAGIASMLPDAMWLRYYINGSINNVESYGFIAKIHKRMQGEENSRGIIIEIFWLAIVLGTFYFFVI